MPKLAAKHRKAAATVENTGGDFKAFPPGKYIATLAKVEARQSAAGNSYWNWEFKDITSLDGTKQPGRLWHRTMLPIDTMPDDYVPGKHKRAGTTPSQQEKEESWKQYQDLTLLRFREAYEAFGYTMDTDTDEMVGEKVALVVGVTTQQQGANAGKEVNEINGLESADDYETDTGDGNSDDDDF